MSQEKWNAIDQYISEICSTTDPVMEAVLSNSAAGGLPAINVSPNQGKMLHLLARMHGAKKILEIGTLGGYSTIWMARALPGDGRLITLEFEPKHAEIARKNIAHAAFAEQVTIHVGPAIDTLPKLVSEGPFDFVFVDADKQSTAEYFTWALKLTRPGSVIIVDNVVRDGEIINPDSADPGVAGVRRFNELLRHEKRVSATAIQTVGSKGYDGFALLLVTG
jgi:predicted O-methyltransferase YrrM